MNNSPYRSQGMVDTKHFLDEIESLKKENKELKEHKEINSKNDGKIWWKTVRENDVLGKENKRLQEEVQKLQEEVKKIKEEPIKQVPLETYKEVKVINLKNDRDKPFFGGSKDDRNNPNAKPEEGSTSHILSEHAKYGWVIKHVDLDAERYLLEREVTKKK